MQRPSSFQDQMHSAFGRGRRFPKHSMGSQALKLISNPITPAKTHRSLGTWGISCSMNRFGDSRQRQIFKSHPRDYRYDNYLFDTDNDNPELPRFEFYPRRRYSGGGKLTRDMNVDRDMPRPRDMEEIRGSRSARQGARFVNSGRGGPSFVPAMRKLHQRLVIAHTLYDDFLTGYNDNVRAIRGYMKEEALARMW